MTYFQMNICTSCDSIVLNFGLAQSFLAACAIVQSQIHFSMATSQQSPCQAVYIRGYRLLQNQMVKCYGVLSSKFLSQQLLTLNLIFANLNTTLMRKVRDSGIGYHQHIFLEFTRFYLYLWISNILLGECFYIRLVLITLYFLIKEEF